MIKHIYVHTSDLEVIKEIRHLKTFEKVSEYSPELFMNAYQNELGLLKIDNLYIHFVIGKLVNDKCPWCSNEVVFKELSFNELNMLPNDQAMVSCYECVNCRSRGPVKILKGNFKEDPKLYEETKACLKEFYSVRVIWRS